MPETSAWKSPAGDSHEAAAHSRQREVEELVDAHEPLQDGAPGAAFDPDYPDAFDRLRAGSPDAFEALAAARTADPLVKLHAARPRAGQRDDAIELSGSRTPSLSFPAHDVVLGNERHRTGQRLSLAWGVPMAVVSPLILWHANSVPPLDQVVVAMVTNAPEAGAGKAMLFFAALTSISAFFVGQLRAEGMWWYLRDRVIAAAERHAKAATEPVAGRENK